MKTRTYEIFKSVGSLARNSGPQNVSENYEEEMKTSTNSDEIF